MPSHRNLVEQSGRRAVCRHRQSQRSAQRDESTRAQTDALPTHIRAGKHRHAAQVDVDRGECPPFACQFDLQREEAAALERQHRRGRDLRDAAAMMKSKAGGRDEHVEFAERGGSRVELRCVGGDD